ncbi:similar to Saccharomyces cerevisiae YNL210W MER1 Protein with RNA-binding motifs required for meiosis-specific mRNA splicing [Maudiozyma barnettii]|uniref:Similar to Saccharomyces cerevisiae YNL210W MER1 Protein with RNA-binding motifs required for meiosis-specific mRNA splicing n=1 Tax=Maudiozyma barnettii TaxID=61262 RepID=A0A8H2VE15_9SACH|nr:Mer1p [Kazachstania barnettii]CAB4253865.1 similar to Saccharomyces cerevisiae YNL210W MER1 Protein with RNA-binding motifs required for meiosis-specific mRNA splicing [Kazachstania barnettii]CAD1781615.1 similar to Saccharomyces cerevisiae YNL210W MER1 Protein with RNA-binding motifs required for meiosis-specific mRNA splicing [Kazachstania barnettii]
MVSNNCTFLNDHQEGDYRMNKRQTETKDFIIFGKFYEFKAEYNIVVETDIWTFNLLKKYTNKKNISVEIINIIDFSTYIVLIPVTKDIVEILNINNLLKIHLSKPLCQEILPFPNDYIVSNDDKLITFLIEDTSQLYEILLHYNSYFFDDQLINPHIFNQVGLTDDKVVSKTCISQRPDTTLSKTFDGNGINDTPNSSPEISSLELYLNKLQISYLIGKEGYWINFIRESTEAIIKILPIPKKLSLRQINSPRSVFQTIVITGTLFEITNAVILIESTLTNMGYSRI